ncbi:SAICAR synthase-like protein [Acrodontium crateriforme]|uniref:Polynucleotide 5'-hydroxyl-kinase GRC3 n=1 Tax=Acrodontium crateriforme TaxID=150365 RepID=A0AAQ3MD08_9PEZI|nr:SAICAR synthase-like protein [Acrodontium crateriforme]
MALPGLSLPGLGLQLNTPTPLLGGQPSSAPQAIRQEDVPPQAEWRFEAGFGKPFTVKLLGGHAEFFGVELAPNQTYDFSGRKGAIFSWQGCRLEVSGDAESEYVGRETEYAIEWLNVHGMLESARDDSREGPRVLVVGPDHVGKSSLVRSLAGWGVKVGRTPTVVNLDPKEGLLAPPSSLTATTVGSQLDVENGYGISGISGPTVTPVKTPLVYHFPHASPLDKSDVYKALVTRMALSVTNKLEEDAQAKQSGIIIDTSGSLNDPRSNYDIINHIISEFSITLVLCLGSERLYNDLNRRFTTSKVGDESIPVLRISKPGGAVERDASFMKQMTQQQIRQYFFGTSKEPLNPHSHSIPYTDLNVLRAKSAASEPGPENPYGGGLDDDDEDDIPYANKPVKITGILYEKSPPGATLTGSLMAVKYCPGSSNEETVRDSTVMGFVYVAEVDDTRKKIRFLAPHPQRWGDRALVWGPWPEAIADLVV